MSTLQRRQVLGGGLAMAAVAHGARAQPALPPPGGQLAGSSPMGPSQLGPLEVGVVERMDLEDGARARRMATRAYYPIAPGRYPVILFSHGFGGSMTGFANTGRIWASHGYVVLHPTHIDSVQFPDAAANPAIAAMIRSYRAGGGVMAPGQAAALVKMLDDPAYIASRLGDIGYLRNAVLQSDRGLDAAVRARADGSRMGLSGHSFGAYTTVVVSGGALSPPSAAPVPQGFKGFLAISGQGPGRMGLGEHSFGGIARPLMMVTGTRDIGAAGETPAWRLKPYELSPPGRKYAVVVEGFSHAQFDPPPADVDPQGRGAALRGLEVAFWNGVLKADRTAFADLDVRADRSTAADAVWLRRR